MNGKSLQNNHPGRRLVLRGQQLRVLKYIQQRGVSGATDKEVQSALNMRGDTQRPRRRELEQAGLIREADNQRHGCKVWVAVVAECETPARHQGSDDAERCELERQQEVIRKELAELNTAFGHKLDAMTPAEVCELVETLPNAENRDGLRRRFDKLGSQSGFVRPWLLRLLQQRSFE